MISAARIMGLAAVGAALLGVDTVAAPANAQPACKNDRITARSEIRVRGETFATNEAKEKWEKIAEDRFGRSYGKWANAKDTKVECESAKSPRVGFPAKVCTAFGRPCAGERRGSDTTVVEEREENNSRRGDRDRIRDRGDRDRIRDRDDRSRPSRYLRRITRAYQAEMRFQDYLARRRHRAEMWAYRREMAFWRNLERRRYWAD